MATETRAGDGPAGQESRVGPVGDAFWVCGTFEVHDGQITLWRDRFDLVDVTASTLAGTARNLWARLRG